MNKSEKKKKKMKVYSKRSTPSRQQQQTKPSQKRALPPRHSFLTEAVQNALEKQSSKVSFTFYSYY